MNACTPNGTEIIVHLNGVFGLCGNVLLIFLIIVSKTPREMRLFNVVLLYRTVVEACEVLLISILQPVSK